MSCIMKVDYNVSHEIRKKLNNDKCFKITGNSIPVLIGKLKGPIFLKRTHVKVIRIVLFRVF